MVNYSVMRLVGEAKPGYFCWEGWQSIFRDFRQSSVALFDVPPRDEAIDTYYTGSWINPCFDTNNLLFYRLRSILGKILHILQVIYSVSLFWLKDLMLDRTIYRNRSAPSVEALRTQHLYKKRRGEGHWSRIILFKGFQDGRYVCNNLVFRIWILTCIVSCRNCLVCYKLQGRQCRQIARAILTAKYLLVLLNRHRCRRSPRRKTRRLRPDAPVFKGWRAKGIWTLFLALRLLATTWIERPWSVSWEDMTWRGSWRG